jgi:hypothetical protein
MGGIENPQIMVYEVLDIKNIYHILNVIIDKQAYDNEYYNGQHWISNFKKKPCWYMQNKKKKIKNI